MEPVSSCSVAASFPRLAVFRTPATPKTRIAATTTLSRVLHLGLIQGPRKKLCIRARTKRERVSRRRLLVVRAYSAPLNIFLRFVRQVAAAAAASGVSLHRLHRSHRQVPALYLGNSL